MILFGGFYDTITETKYFNDLYIFDLDTLKWTKVEKTALGQVPKPRSGFVMTVFENTLILYGGYSKEKVTKYGEAKGVIHTDLWSINLNNAPNLVWERMKRSGIPPTPRSGMSAILDKRRLLVFGGVFDEEEDIKMKSNFYNDM
jgi:N-acetylneuraminic acid mutarotase